MVGILAARQVSWLQGAVQFLVVLGAHRAEELLCASRQMLVIPSLHRTVSIQNFVTSFRSLAYPPGRSLAGGCFAESRGPWWRGWLSTSRRGYAGSP